ncbi:unnamed protein product [Tuber melanosporum]|uniref:(Perigord truffle) hypothetical protein n=1 Tax=Tuber melanosporum (strain Mel28) TaxID=656061 RepID=D5G7L6_TUBMM|nr:uncharacterized protein GSTUM_00004611001 [Tuber melanosporum]CAZ80509.1 unnamed protein product [Tuber melanosporum]
MIYRQQTIARENFSVYSSAVPYTLDTIKLPRSPEPFFRKSNPSSRLSPVYVFYPQSNSTIRGTDR